MPAASSLRLLAAVMLLGVGLAGCGKPPLTEGQGHGAAVTTVAGTGQVVVSGLATANTTRLGGEDPVADAAAVALATHPGLTPATRPQAVVLVDKHAWPVALAAATLASQPLGAPLLYAEGDALPPISEQALTALKPTGAGLLEGAQVIEIGTVAAPARYRTHTLGKRSTGGGGNGSPEPGGSTGGSRSAGALAAQATLAARIERLVETLQGGAPHRVIVVGADGPSALAMPAAGLAAESGAPILLVGASGVPTATRAVLARLHSPAIYAIGPPTAVSHAVLSELEHLGPVHRIYSRSGAGSSPAAAAEVGQEAARNAIAVARFSDGAFGWGIEQPGHGLVFANASRPLDAPAAASLSASGDYGPLLLLEHPGQVSAALSEYLLDIQPGYTDAPEYQPVRGVYNHGWLIGDERAITASTQAALDSMLAISPRNSANPPTAPSTAFP